MESRVRSFARQSFVGLMGLFSAAATLPQTLYFKDSTRTTDYRFDTSDGYDYQALDYFQAVIDSLSDGTCGADTSNISCIPRFYDMIQRWHFSTQFQTGPAALYRGASQVVLQTFEDCLKFLINISDVKYQQFQDQQASDQTNRAQTGLTTVGVGMGILALIVIGVITGAAITYHRRLKQAKRSEATDATDEKKADSPSIKA